MKKSISLLLLLFVASLVCYHFDRSSENFTSTPQEQSPFGRDQWRSAMRAHDASPEKILKARNQLLATYKKGRVQKDAGLNKWRQLDTHEKAGRVRTIAVHPTDPDILYTGGVSGGIWKTDDAGASWEPLNDFLPSLSVTSIIIHPEHPDTMYAATGEGITGGREFNSSSPGAGIFRTKDGGDNWKLIGALDEDDLEGFYWINKIVFDPDDPSIFYATKDGSSQESTSFGGARLYKFENHGESKTEVSYNDVAGSLTNIVFNPSDPNDILLCSSGGLYISQDKGVTWDNMITKVGWPAVAGRVEVGMSASASETIYAICAGDDSNPSVFLRSDDMGETWDQLNVGISFFQRDGGPHQGYYDNVIWVDPFDINNVIIGGISLWRMVTAFVGGSFITGFEEISDGAIAGSPHADQHVIVPASDYSSTSKRLYIGNDGGIARTDDFTSVTKDTGWELLNNGLYITQFYASDIDGPGPDRIIGGSQDNGTLLSEDMGSTWTDEFSGDGGYCGFSQQDNELIYVSMQNGRFFASCINTSGVEAYFPVLLMDGRESNPPFIAPMKVYPQDGEKIIAGGENVYLVEFDPSTCFGTVNVVNPIVPPVDAKVTAIDINKDGDITIIGYSDGSVYRTTSLPGAAMFWNEIYQHPTGDPITDIAISPINNNKVAISTGGYDDDNVFISVNTNVANPNDVIWHSRSDGIPALQVNTLAWHPEKNSWIYAGTDLGIMASEDNGQNWNVSPNFMGVSDGPAFTEVSNLQFSESSLFATYNLVATTYGRGIWKSRNAVRSDVYIDENALNITEVGTADAPWKIISNAENAQAHGQTWHIDGGDYPVDTSNKIVLDKRLGEVKLTGSGPVIIGNN